MYETYKSKNWKIQKYKNYKNMINYNTKASVCLKEILWTQNA